jgi:hypothetical protein
MNKMNKRTGNTNSTGVTHSIDSSHNLSLGRAGSTSNYYKTKPQSRLACTAWGHNSGVLATAGARAGKKQRPKTGIPVNKKRQIDHVVNNS